MQDSLNWDFTFCQKFPNRIIESIFQYEEKRDKMVLKGEEPGPPLSHDEQNIKDLLYEEMLPSEWDAAKEVSELIIPIGDPRHEYDPANKYPYQEWGWHVVTFRIHESCLLNSKSDTKLKYQFARWITAERKRLRTADTKKTDYYTMLRDLAYYRLKEAGWEADSAAAQKCFAIYPKTSRSTKRKTGHRRDPEKEIWTEAHSKIKDRLNDICRK